MLSVVGVLVFPFFFLVVIYVANLFYFFSLKYDNFLFENNSNCLCWFGNLYINGISVDPQHPHGWYDTTTTSCAIKFWLTVVLLPFFFLLSVYFICNMSLNLRHAKLHATQIYCANFFEWLCIVCHWNMKYIQKRFK